MKASRNPRPFIFGAGVLFVLTIACAALHAQTSDSRNGAGARLARQQSRYRQQRNGDDVDRAAGRLVDSLFEPTPPADLLPRSVTNAVRSLPLGSSDRYSNGLSVADRSERGAGAQGSSPREKPAWKGRLVRNPRTDDGRPPYVIVDRDGGVQRYVEPSKKVDLENYVGKYVTVRRDTGDTLLVDQLVLPQLGAESMVRTAGHEETTPEEPIPEETVAPGKSAPIPTPADLSHPMVVEGEPMEIDDGLHFEGEPMETYGGGIYHDGLDNSFDGGFHGGMRFDHDPCAGGGCPTCGSAVCGKSPCGFGSRPILYVRGQYLLWWVDGMDTPPLVVQDPVNDTFQNAEVIYGGEELLDDVRSGGRVALGYWLDDYGRWGIEGDYLGLETLNERFVAGARDGQIPNISIGRPFINGFDFDANGDGDVNDPGDVPRGRAVEEVDTRSLDGSVTVDVDSRFQSAGLRLRRGLCCCAASCGTGCGDHVGCGVGIGCGDAVGCGAGCGAAGLGPLMGVRRIDATFGVRWAQLDEGLRITEDLQTRDAQPTTFFLRDQFDTSNEFIGGDFGFIWEWEHRRLSLEILSRLALGSTRQRVRIAGSTLRDDGQQTESLAQGGLLALPSNIGSYTRDQFSVMPELGVTCGYLVTDRLRFTVGYSFLYWSNVVRPGDQIDNVIDITQVPVFEGVVDPTNPAVQPRFAFRETGLWAHGINLGADYRW